MKASRRALRDRVVVGTYLAALGLLVASTVTSVATLVALGVANQEDCPPNPPGVAR